MNDTTDRRRLLAGVLIAAGVLWLLVASGFIPRRLVFTLLGFWPLLPIGIGLDMLFERKPFDVPFTALALAAMIVLAIVLPGSGVIESRFVEPVDGAVRAEVILDLGSTPATMRPLVGSDLFRADIVDTREVRFRSSGREVRRIELAPAGARGGGRLLGEQPHWNLRLTTDLPIALAVSAGSGPVDLDLSGVRLETLTFDGASGGARATLPNSGERYAVRFDLASGSSDIITDPGADVVVEISGGSGGGSLTFARGTRLTLNLAAASGSWDIDLPDAGAILLRVEDDGSGSVTVPSFLEQIEGSTDRGVWRSRGSGSAEPEITITVKRAGSGNISFR